MKITRLEIADYQQFKDFAIDLTYPAGHPKAGEPLDKVCLIGQSGTGKTTILNVLKDFLDKILTDPRNISNSPSDNIKNILQKMNFKYDKVEYKIQKTINNYDYSDRFSYNYNGIDFLNEKFIFLPENKINDKPYYLYLPADLDFDIKGTETDDFIKMINGFFNGNKELEPVILEMKRNLEKQKKYDFSKSPILDIWKLILYDSRSYIKATSNLRSEIGTAYIAGNTKLADTYKIEFEKLESSSDNPLKTLINVVNDKVSGFNVSASLNINIEDFNDLKFIKILTKNGKPIDFKGLSTGTKQIILTAMPISRFKDVVVLFDEPERSLYPDVQRELINYYTDLAPESQFFFATHSPLIASQFEPWEIVELKFDEAGKVYRELYYDVEKENHVDNYTIFPQYLSWDSILTKVFDLKVRGNEKHQTKLKELAILEVKLRNAPQEQKRDIWEQYEKLAYLLDWHIDA